MPQINLASGSHGNLTLYPGTSDEARFWPYPDNSPQLKVLKHAFHIIKHNIYKKNNACNAYFRKLASGRSFDDVWNDSRVWVSYEDRTGLGWDGQTNAVGGTEITLGEDAFRQRNIWYLTAVLVHELAHVGGAGVAPSKAASEALKSCGLAALYDGAIGAIRRADKPIPEATV